METKLTRRHLGKLTMSGAGLATVALIASCAQNPPPAPTQAPAAPTPAPAAPTSAPAPATAAPAPAAPTATSAPAAAPTQAPAATQSAAGRTLNYGAQNDV